MKKSGKIAVCVALFTALLYHQEPALNLSIIVLFTWALLAAGTAKKRVSRKVFRMLSLAVIVSSLSFAWYGDALSFLAMAASLLAAGIYRQYPSLNYLLYPLLVGFNYCAFVFRVFWIRPAAPPDGGGSVFKKIVAFVMVPALLGILFIAVYTTGSDLFLSFFEGFYLRFDFMSLLLLAVLGCFLFINFWRLWIPREALRFQRFLEDDFSEPRRSPRADGRLDFERRSGEISLVVVNSILLFFLITYNYEQFFTPVGIGNFSEEVHQRVVTIIFSILMAVALLMYYFKSTYNFDPDATLLKRLAFVWIGLNVLLILSAGIKNAGYISAFGLTQKRIGVYLFLMLSLIGLWVTWQKIRHRKTNAYLLRRMLRVFFVTMVVCSPINFSWLITRYNLSFHKNEDPTYLQTLPYNYRVLYRVYQDDPDWAPYFKRRQQQLLRQRAKPFLSTPFYDRFTGAGLKK